MSIAAAVLGSLAVDMVGTGAKNSFKEAQNNGVLPRLLSKGSLKVTADRLNKMGDMAHADSLVSASQPSRVEPVMLMDTTLANVPFITDVVATMHSLFTGLYLMAINLDHEVNGVSARSRLSKYNPERSVINAGRDLVALGLESNTPVLMTSQYIGLPSSGSLTRNELFDIKPSNEASATDMNRVVQDVSNLAVGKLIDVNIGGGGENITVPVQIRLLPLPATPKNVLDIFTVGTYDGTLKNRWREFRAGNISFWRDLVLAGDRIDAYAQSAIKDKSGYLKEMQRRSGKSAVAFALTGEPSPSTASSIIVISSATADELYREHGIDINNYKLRQDIFKRTYAMIICVVDPEWETAEFFYRGIERSTQVNAANMKRSSKGDGADVMELMKVYMSGSAPGRL